MDKELNLKALLDARDIMYLRQAKAILSMYKDKLMPIVHTLGIPFDVEWESIERYPIGQNSKYVIIVGLTKIPEEILKDELFDEDENFNLVKLILPIKTLNSGTSEDLVTAFWDLMNLKKSLSPENFIKLLTTTDFEGSIMSEENQEKFKQFLDRSDYDGFSDLTKDQIKDIMLYQRTTTSEKKH
jgi:hypothetical protein